MEKTIFRKYNVLLSVLIFFFVLFVIFLQRDKMYLFYPFIYFSLLPLRKKDEELRFLIIFLGSIIVFLFPEFSNIPRPDVYLVAILELFSFWGFAYIVQEFLESERKKMEEVESEISKNLYELKNIQSDFQVYKRHIEKLKKQLELRKELSKIIKNLQQTKSFEEIKRKIEEFLKNSFLDFKVELISEVKQDKLLSFIYNSKLPLLVKNVDLDVRFNRDFFKEGEKSILCVPVIVSGNVLAIIKIVSFKPDGLGEEELRLVEILANIASISVENINLFNKVLQLAIKDPLTGLYTHRYFQDKLDEEILRSARTRLPFSLVLADIDHFKDINDTYGHQTGDLILKETARLFSLHLREIDILARYGGEEFVFILPGVEKRKAFEFSEFLRSKMAEIVIPGVDRIISASFGIAEFPLEAVSKSQLIRVADERLYKAKKSGRNICIYE